MKASWWSTSVPSAPRRTSNSTPSAPEARTRSRAASVFPRWAMTKGRATDTTDFTLAIQREHAGEIAGTSASFSAIPRAWAGPWNRVLSCALAPPAAQLLPPSLVLQRVGASSLPPSNPNTRPSDPSKKITCSVPSDVSPMVGLTCNHVAPPSWLTRSELLSPTR